VLDVARDSQAWAAGLRSGDYVSLVGKQRVRTPGEFLEAVENLRGDVALSVFSGDQVLTRVVAE
jgi:hypothetical protein